MNKALHVNECVVHEHSNVHLKLTAKWKGDKGEHAAIQHIEKFNVWRDMDLLPDEIMKDILHHGVGRGEKHHFTKGELLGNWQSSLLKKIPRSSFTGRSHNGEQVTLREGRYYPMGWFSGVDDIYSDNMFPARVIQIDDKMITVDYNHPLSKYAIDVSVEIVEIFPPADEHGGRCSDAIETLLSNGPGMQLENSYYGTNFFVDSAFKRIDEDKDEEFYQVLRKVHHLDENARKSISELYAQLIKPQSHVLDLMASWDSHLPKELSNVHLSCLGMNEEELRMNKDMTDYLVHDLNLQSITPYAANSFDAVICTASVEYLVYSLGVFNEIYRVLKPGGVCIMTFSNRFFPTKAISLWSEIHDFERIGLVMEYFRKSNWSKPVNSCSIRGMRRPKDDPHYSKTQVSDPVYAVWCYK